MGMLKSISLKNYKCFKDEITIDIAPLTVLCGVNSSGKSSILKSLLILKQSYENNYDSNSLLLNGNYTFNGTFNDVLNNESKNSFTIQDEFKIDNGTFLIKEERNTLKEIADIFNYDYENINSVIITVNISVKKKKLEKLYITDNVIQNYIIKVNTFFKNNNESTATAQLKIRTDNFYDIELDSFPHLNHATLKKCNCYFDGLKLVNLFFDKDETIDYVNFSVFANVFSLFRIAALQYKGIKYIAPLRNEPDRTSLLLQDQTSVGLHGEFTSQIIASYFDKDISAILPPINDILSLKTQKENLIDILNSWSNYLCIGNIEPYLSENSDSIKLIVNDHNIADVGFGVSQVLPILTTGLLMKTRESLILQQPEIHLHPNMQMNFADYLLSLAIRNKNVIIETHSDHIINRITRRVMEDKTGSLHKLIKIYFVQGYNNECPIYKDIKFDPIDGLVNAPNDFFTQFGSELMHITKTGMINLREGIVW